MFFASDVRAVIRFAWNHSRPRDQTIVDISELGWSRAVTNKSVLCDRRRVR